LIDKINQFKYKRRNQFGFSFFWHKNGHAFENFTYEKDFYELDAAGGNQLIGTGSRKGWRIIKK
jgi:hypothetical protein